jgi:tRNA nucleotidyltransferase (CCA-adding enzyme)
MCLDTPPLERIVSGGQTGVDRAALDAAASSGIPAGGYCPAGRRAEDGAIPARYPLVETSSPRYEVRTKRNVRESDGTLVLTEGVLSGGTLVTVEYATVKGKPCLVVPLDGGGATPAQVVDWLSVQSIRVLNVAGPRESKVPGVYGRYFRFLRRVMDLIAIRQRRASRSRVTSFLRELFPRRYRQEIFLVGGSVRDFLLGAEIQDIDLAASLPAEALVAVGFRKVETKSSAPIWFRYDRGIGKIEVTSLGGAHELSADLARRDFTVNAMAMTLSGRLLDPLGARRDLKHRLLRVCSDRTFVDDPLRIFRAFRFESYGWRMTPETEGLIRARNWSEALRSIPMERFSREMMKALGGGIPARFFRRMREFDAGEEFLPELFRMPQVPAGPIEHHPEGDLFAHSLEVLERVAHASGDVTSRFCALFHDLGKLITPPALHPRHHGHDELGGELAKEFCNRLCLPAALRTALAGTCQLHTTANRWQELRGATKISLAERARRAGIGNVLPLVSSADKPAGGVMTGWDVALEVAGMDSLALGISPDRLESMQPPDRTAYILQKRVEAFRAKSPPAD